MTYRSPKYKVGDVVEVYRNGGNCKHFFKMPVIGSIVKEYPNNEVVWNVEVLKGNKQKHSNQWIHVEDMRPYESFDDPESKWW